MSDYFRSLVAKANELLDQEAEARPNINWALLNDARMEIYLAEQVLTQCPDLATDKILHFAFKSHLKHAHKLRLMIAAEPYLERDAKRQAGTEKERGPRWQEIDDFIRAALERKPVPTYEAIWKQVCESDDSRTYYVDGDKIYNSDSGRKLGFSGFSKRATKIKEEIKKPR